MIHAGVVPQEPVSDALALIHRALAMRNYGDKPVLWEQVWKDIEDAAQRLGEALRVGSEAAVARPALPAPPSNVELCPTCGAPARYQRDGEDGEWYHVGALPAAPAPPDDKRLSEIQARLEAATPGPWEQGTLATEDSSLRIWKDLKAFSTSILIADVAIVHTDSVQHSRTHDNAAFIAHAPEDIRYLLDLVGSRPSLAGSGDK